MARKRYLFTNKKNPERGIFSAALGVIALLGIFCALVISYKNGGAGMPRLGVSVFFAALMGVAGLVMGILSHMEPDMFTFFPKLGIVLNILVLASAGVILYMGV